MKNLYIIGNWKMNKTIKATKEFFEAFNESFNEKTKNHVVICPPFMALPTACELAEGKKFEIGAQNVHYSEDGIYTGEVSTEMLNEVGVKYSIVGHSSRREDALESNEVINKKIIACLEAGITPVLCVGESRKDKEMGRTYKVLKKQLVSAFDDISEPNKVIIAYEPIWAISDGKNPAQTPTMEEISGASSGIRRVMKQLYDKDALKGLNVLYGGSVGPANANEIMSIKNINGVLVGGASLNPDKFNAIIKAVD